MQERQAQEVPRSCVLYPEVAKGGSAISLGLLWLAVACVWDSSLSSDQSEVYAIKRSNTLSNCVGQSRKVDEGAEKANPCRLT